MRRKIKFRGREIGTGEWKYGSNVDIDADRWIICEGTWDAVQVEPDSVGEYVEVLDAYEGDKLAGCDKDEYNSTLATWVGQIKYNEAKGRLMILEEVEEDWYEIDDYEFDEVLSLSGIESEIDKELKSIMEGIIIGVKNTPE